MFPLWFFFYTYMLLIRWKFCVWDLLNVSKNRLIMLNGNLTAIPLFFPTNAKDLRAIGSSSSDQKSSWRLRSMSQVLKAGRKESGIRAGTPKIPWPRHRSERSPPICRFSAAYLNAAQLLMVWPIWALAKFEKKILHLRKSLCMFM